MSSAAAVQGLGQSPVRPVRRSACSEESSKATPRDAPDDLLHLEDFNDTELLRALWTRYERKEIYTWVGSVLVSVNPYRDINAFSEERAARYASKSPPKAPHLYAAVRTALTAPGDRHALLITGESGAGKTEATRAVLSFLAMRHRSADARPTDYIRDRLLRSTPVLEAFGNAQTRQNTNSSRFGKFIEVHLSKNLEVVGATLQPYMLEASRVAGDLPVGEFTYHVFYLLRATLNALSSGTTPEGHFWTRLAHAPEWVELAKICSTALSNSARLEKGPPADRCLAGFEELHEGLVKVGVKHSEVADCCRIVAAVSLLADVSADESVLSVAASLLRIPVEDLQMFIQKAEISVGTQRRERFHRTRSEGEASTLRASFAQELYASLFGWLTRLVARGIAPPSQDLHGGRALGLLDLYGFEVFEKNGFEQFLINYCNERLQQFFNQQVFTKEAEEYEAEGLDSDGQWRRLVTACQLPALTLLEGEAATSTVGVFGVINDRSRCRFEEAKQDSGAVLAQSIASSCGPHSAFRTATRDASRVFGIAHFAGEVFYETSQFAQKNASAHRPDIVAFLKEKGGTFVHELVAGEAEDASVPTGGNQGQRKLFGRTLITQFREQLNELCVSLDARECHHVRCLRPNDTQKPMVFDDVSMLRQCRYSGLLEATRIRRQGYAHRRALRSFAAKYALLLNKRNARAEARLCAQSLPMENVAYVCTKIKEAALSSSDINSEDATIGRTKVFLRENALVWFEQARKRVAGGIILALLRANHTRQYMHRLRIATSSIQSITRGRRARIFVRRLRAEIRAAEERAAAARYAAELRAAEEAAQLSARMAVEEAEIARAACACCVLQRWWRHRVSRMRSMVAEMRREQTRMELHIQCQRGSNPKASSPEKAHGSEAQWPPAAPTACADRLAARCEKERAERAAAWQSERRAAEKDQENRGKVRGTRTKEDQSRKPCALASRLNRPPKVDKAKKEKKERDGSVRRKAGHEGSRHGTVLPRTTSSPNLERRSHKPAGGSSRFTLNAEQRRGYRQDIARLLAQHRVFCPRLPHELRGLPGQLMEAAQQLDCNGSHVSMEVLAGIDELLRSLKAALRDQTTVSAYYPMPESYFFQSPEVHHRQQLIPHDATPLGWAPHDSNRASAPALLQSWSPPFTNAAHPGSFAFYAPPLVEDQQCGMRHSLTARSVIRPMSPTTVRSSLSPATARAAGFSTPVRSRATVGQVSSIRVSTPVSCTPRQVGHTISTTTTTHHADGSTTIQADGASTPSVPSWAWMPTSGASVSVQAGGSVTAQAAPASAHVPMPMSFSCAPQTTCSMTSPPLDKAREVHFLASIPTPSRKHGHLSPCPQVRVPMVQCTATAIASTTVSAPVQLAGSAQVPIQMPKTGSAQVPGTPQMSPLKQSSATPGVPLLQHSLSFSHKELVVPAWARTQSTPLVGPMVGGIGPSRCSSPPRLPA